MNILQKLLSIVAIYTLSHLTGSVHAHMLGETTAQVILRDGQIEIKVITDIDHLTSALKNNQAWLLGDIDAVMPNNLSINEQSTFIKNALASQMNVVVNKQILEIKHVALQRDKNAAKGEITFQVKHEFLKVSELSVTFHKSLGAVHISFSKPQYKLLSAGKSAHVTF